MYDYIVASMLPSNEGGYKLKGKDGIKILGISKELGITFGRNDDTNARAELLDYCSV